MTKTIVFTDKDGYLKRSTIMDDDPDYMAECGIPAGPPDLRGIDIDAMLKEMNNILVANGLFNWDDVQRTPGGIQPAVNVLKRAIIDLYRQEYQTNKHN